MNQRKNNLCAIILLTTTSLPVWAESIDLKVIGTINPTACTPTLGGGGTIDYGSIPKSSIATSTYTNLAERQVDFTITCDSPAKVALSVQSQRAVSAVSRTDGKLSVMSLNNQLFGDSTISAFGLGLSGTKGIGGYGIRIDPATVLADGKEVDSIRASGNTTSWVKATTGSLINSVAGLRYVSWATQGSTVPAAFTTLTGKLGVQAYINKASELDLTKPVTLDGLATIELIYL